MMGNWIVKFEGETVRLFQNRELADVEQWRNRYCKHGVIVGLEAQKGLPKASRRRHPNEDLPDLRYKPFNVEYGSVAVMV